MPLSKTGAELLFELISQCYERRLIIITSNLPFDEWTDTFASERLTGALVTVNRVNRVNLVPKNFLKPSCGLSQTSIATVI